MKCGAPVLASDSSSLKEVQLLSEARFDPQSVDDIAASMSRVLTDEGLAERLRTQELPAFTWEKAAQLTAEVIRELGRPRVARGDECSPSRLAVVSPLAGRSSDAFYVRNLVTELAPSCDLTLFTDVEAEQAALPADVTVRPMRWLPIEELGGGAFDRTLYVLGGDASHVEAWALLAEHPGWVLLRDVRMAELYNRIAELAPEQLVMGSVGATLAELYPGRYRPELERMPTIPRPVADRFGVLLALDIARKAQVVVVDSHYAGWSFELDTGVRPLIPFSAPYPEVSKVAEPSPTPGDAILVFGAANAPADWSSLVEALVAVRRQAEVRLLVVPPEASDQRSDLETAAAAHAVADVLELVDLPDQARLAQAPGGVTLAIQMSGLALGDADAFRRSVLLAAGVPTIVTDAAARADLPDGAVAKVSLSAGPSALAEVILALLRAPARRRSMAQTARNLAARHSFAQAAVSLAEELFPWRRVELGRFPSEQTSGGLISRINACLVDAAVEASPDADPPIAR
jgi:hypothetical protein